jgi:hypothetical protein
MDPYIEMPRLWPDFHNNLAPEIRAQLNRTIQPKYVALLTPTVTYERVELSRRANVVPDVGVFATTSEAIGGGVAVAATTRRASSVAMSEFPMEVPTSLSSIEVRLVESDVLVAVIEILSPGNKRAGSQAQRKYLTKRRELLNTAVHFLEIDLLRGGQRPPLEKSVPPAPYYVTLGRAFDRPLAEVRPIQLRDRLPVVPVPLAPPDKDASFDLAAAVAAVYEGSGYATLIDYRRPTPGPPLSAEERLFVEEVLRERRAGA